MQVNGYFRIKYLCFGAVYHMEYPAICGISVKTIRSFPWRWACLSRVSFWSGC